MFIPSGCKDIVIIKFEFFAKINFFQNCLFKIFSIITLLQILTQGESICQKRTNIDRFKIYKVFWFVLLVNFSTRVKIFQSLKTANFNKIQF